MTNSLTNTVTSLLEINKHDIARFIDLTLEKRKLARETKVINDAIKVLTEDIIQQFEDAEMVESIRVKGYNVKPDRQLWVSTLEGDHERGCNALVDSGHAEYVARRFDARKVSALIREYDRDGEIPQELADNLQITEKFVLSMIKGASKK